MREEWGGGGGGADVLLIATPVGQGLYRIYLSISIYIGECVCILPSIYVAVCGPIGTKFGTHMQIHLEKVVGKIKICPV